MAIGVPGAAAFAILRHRLYGIEVVLKRTVVFAVLGAFVAAVYLALVLGVGSLVTDPGTNRLVVFAAAGIAALAFQPLRLRAGRLADRLVYGERASPYQVLSEFSERVGGTYSTDDVLPRLVRLLAAGTGATSTHVWLCVGNQLRPEASWPDDTVRPAVVARNGDGLPEFPGEGRGFAVRHRGELLGALTLSTPPSEPLTASQERLVEDLAAQVGLVLRNVRLIEELRASRQRIVAAQDARAKQLERNIHDGAQQQLVALAVKLRLARGLVRADPDRAESMLVDLQDVARSSLEDLRDLARGIYPPLLADAGLVEALTAQARKSSVPAEVEATGVSRYGQEVESAVYFACLEALQNVAKYAGAGRVRIELRSDDGRLTFSVIDDGFGFDTGGATLGTGLQGIADRIEAVGGTFLLRSAPGGGTSVGGSIPVAG